MASITKMGNTTINLSYRMIAEKMHISPESDKIIRKSIDEWKILKKLRNIPVDINQEAKIQKQRGRQTKIMKFELHPDAAWCGLAEQGIGYSNSLKDFEDLV